MPFTAKVKITGVESVTDDESKVSFTANYTDAEGNRVNQAWAKYTPGFQLTMWLKQEFVQAQALAPGQDFELLFTPED